MANAEVVDLKTRRVTRPGRTEDDEVRELIAYYRAADPVGQTMILRAARLLMRDPGPTKASVRKNDPMQAVADDAELLSACAEFCRLLRTAHDAQGRLKGRKLENAIAELSDRQEVYFHRIIELRATTPEGHRARAQALHDYLDPSDLKISPDNGSWDRLLTAALLRDLLSAGPSAAPVSRAW